MSVPYLPRSKCGYYVDRADILLNERILVAVWLGMAWYTPGILVPPDAPVRLWILANMGMLGHRPEYPNRYFAILTLARVNTGFRYCGFGPNYPEYHLSFMADTVRQLLQFGTVFSFGTVDGHSPSGEVARNCILLPIVPDWQTWSTSRLN